MFCTECGEEYQEETNFCPNCGTDLTLYHDKGPDLNLSGSLERFQSADKEDPLEGEVFIREDSQNDETRIDHTNRKNESTKENPENWLYEKEQLEGIIQELELENQYLRENLENTNQKLGKPSAKAKKVGVPHPHKNSPEDMWNKFKKWYNE